MTSPSTADPVRQPGSIDPRGPRFTASVTLVLFVVVLLSPRWVSVGLLVAQTLFFAIGVLRGVQFTPTGVVFRRLIRPRLAPPAELEDERPPRFAQGVGLCFALVALIGYASGATPVGAVAAGFALAAALLNAVFGFCLGCELYLLIRRVAPSDSAGTTHTSIESTNKKEAIA
jgi:hypothetical protein